MDLPDRKKNRLDNFDYGQNGSYFVTLCTQNRKQIFEIEPLPVGNDQCVVPQINTHKNPCLQNQIIHKWVKITEKKFPNIKFDKYVIMPDHLHFIVFIFNGIIDVDKERHIGRSLHDAMRFFKTMTTNEYIKCVKYNLLPSFDKKLWQKSYYDHIIRNQHDYDETWEYIDNNPINWILKHQKQDQMNI